MAKKAKDGKRQYLYRQPQANGTVYVYFRMPRTGKLTRLPDDEASQEFADAYDPLLRAAKQPRPAPRSKDQLGRWKNPRDYTIDAKVVFRPGSVGWFIDKYKTSEFGLLKLSSGTQYNYGFALDVMKKKLGTGMLHDFNQRSVDIYTSEIADQHGGAAADQQRSLITNLWRFAKRFAEFKPGDKLCPTLGAIHHYEHDGVGILAWPENVYDAAIAKAKRHLVEIISGLRYTGQRGSDLVDMQWDDYDGKRINVVQQKTGERIWLTCPAPFKQMLDTMPRHDPVYIFTNCWKRPYKHAGTLGTAIRHLVQKKLKLPDYSMHGLRKNAGMELALAGCSVSEIMAVLGHKSPKMAMFYVKQASKVQLSETATAKLETYLEGRGRERIRYADERIAERRAKIKRVK
ncbi:tyrosine-type recombinase/integrase [Bradyrhizobium sp. CCGUVB14]|uniref:tyrosine-type recombinase/integrase n=1 Tax=Bradyrhizobium sp. CCGUVB14 TaxID=2949628 RepID=UPI0020B1DB3A|nr:tyrosine-type recombinase/integrase [Bradyrhizobium sp. CCGUVB14]MCP3444187.1 tyrosine-type recombinase/integrase [Bradyrhizobium sp. CCGUVB14]